MEHQSIFLHHTHINYYQGGAAAGANPVDAREEKRKEKEEFQKMWKSVMDLGKSESISGGVNGRPVFLIHLYAFLLHSGASQLKGYDKKQYDARKIVELGGKVRLRIAIARETCCSCISHHHHDTSHHIHTGSSSSESPL